MAKRPYELMNLETKSFSKVGLVAPEFVHEIGRVFNTTLLTTIKADEDRAIFIR